MRAAASIAIGMTVLVLTMPTARAADDAKKLVGTYKIDRGESMGEEVAKERIAQNVVKITEDTIMLGTADQADMFVIPYTLDTSKSPWGISMTIKKGIEGSEGSIAKGIIAVEGDTVKLAYGYMDGPTPTEFKTKKGENQHLFVLKRQ